MGRSRPDELAGRRRAARALLLAAALLAGGQWTAASGVDGAGRIVVIPLVMSDPNRESVITLTNTGREELKIEALYVGADGTPMAGEHPCNAQSLPADGSVTVRLRDLCSDLAAKPDAEDFGYLELTSTGDTTLNFFATTTVETDLDRSFGVAGQPVGAFSPATDLGVIGLRALSAGNDEKLFCYAAALHEGKTVLFVLADSSNTTLGLRGLSLAPREMQRIDLLPWLGLTAANQDNLRVHIYSTDDAVAVAGCALEHTRTHVLAYQAAQAGMVPEEMAHLREVNVEGVLDAGPYKLGYAWAHTMVGGSTDVEVILSTYLRWNDNVRCYVTAPRPPAFDSSPWLEIQVRDPLGKVMAGGDHVQDTGVFYTGHAGQYPAGQRWWIEISFDEAASRWPNTEVPGYWALHCDSAAGMSRPMAVDDGRNKDDF